MRLRYTRRARRDIEEIYNYIAQSNPDAAKRVENAIRRTAEFPESGVVTDEPKVRRFPLVRFDYTIFNRIADHELQVLRVRHGRQLQDPSQQ